jgi:hypothetical protein
MPCGPAIFVEAFGETYACFWYTDSVPFARSKNITMKTFQLIFVAGAQHEPGAFGGELTGENETKPARAAGNQHHSVLEVVTEAAT